MRYEVIFCERDNSANCIAITVRADSALQAVEVARPYAPLGWVALRTVKGCEDPFLTRRAGADGGGKGKRATLMAKGEESRKIERVARLLPDPQPAIFV